MLPATTQLEHLDVHTSYGHTYAMINEPAIAPLGEAKPNTQIFRELAARMGFDEPCFADDDEALARDRVRRRDGGSISPRCARDGWVKLPTRRGAVRRRRLPDAERQGARSTSPGLGVPDYVAELRIGGEHARARARASRWR